MGIPTFYERDFGGELGSALGGIFANYQRQNQKNQQLQREQSSLQEALSLYNQNPEAGIKSLISSPYISPENKKLTLQNIQHQQELAQKGIQSQESKNREQIERDKLKIKEEELNLKKSKNYRNEKLYERYGLGQNNEQIQPETSQNEPPNIQNPNIDFKKISDEEITGMAIENPQLARVVQKAKQEAINKERVERKEKIEFHKESEKYEEKLLNSEERVLKQQEAIEDIRDSIKSGKVTPGKFSAIFKGFGTIGDKLAEAFKNAEQGKFEAALPILLEGWKDVFGVRLTDADLRILQDKLPGIGKDPEANESILGVIEKYSKPILERAQIARDIKKQNGGLRPLGFRDMVEEEYSRKRQKEKENKKVPQGTVITEDIALEFIKKAKGDEKLAQELAKEAGYEF